MMPLGGSAKKRGRRKTFYFLLVEVFVLLSLAGMFLFWLWERNGVCNAAQREFCSQASFFDTVRLCEHRSRHLNRWIVLEIRDQGRVSGKSDQGGRGEQRRALYRVIEEGNPFPWREVLGSFELYGEALPHQGKEKITYLPGWGAAVLNHSVRL